MKYFFAENCDWIDPQYDFEQERSASGRKPQLDDLYPHEYFDRPPYDGLLVSRSIVGGEGFLGRYTQGQRHRLQREGVRSFLRFPHAGYSGDPMAYPIMGDCGSYSYIDKVMPVVTNEQIIEYYTTCGFTHAVSVDHIIIAKKIRWDDQRRLPNWVSARAEFTYQSALEFLRLCRSRKVRFVPIGVVQSWSPRSAAQYAKKLVSAGYDYIGLGGLVGRSWQYIFNTISEVRAHIHSDTRIHIFGFAYLKKIEHFIGLNIASFDSTAPVLKAFKDDRENYYADTDPHYTAIRIPPLNEDQVKRRIQSGQLDQDRTQYLENRALSSVRGYGRRQTDLESTMEDVLAYESHLYGKSGIFPHYRRTLADRPWEKCTCRACKELGVEVVVYRGQNRNKRRGYHNLVYFYGHCQKVIKTMNRIDVPCIKTEQNPGKFIYSFVVDGKKIPQFAAISRIGRDDSGTLLGYQRPEIQEHINEIKAYLDRSDAILPNSIVIAFHQPLDYEELAAIGPSSSVGTLRIDLARDDKIGWLVDGQQRVAALRSVTKDHLPVSVVGFESHGPAEEREQFILVNTTKPLPKSLVYELLPSVEGHIPPKMRKRKNAYIYLEKLNLREGSPFYRRICTTTNRHLDGANIKDLSVLKMIENSLREGVLFRFQKSPEKALALLHNYWSAVKSTYPEAWSPPPKKSRLTHGVGIVSMGFLMDMIGYKLASNESVPSCEQFSSELKTLGTTIPWTEGVWQFSDDMRMPWNELQNTSRHIDLVANHLIRIYRSKGG